MDPPIATITTCTTNDDVVESSDGNDTSSINNDDIQELLVIGAGPHGLSLVLRLLEPDADFLTDKDRHLQAEHRHRMARPDRDVARHIRKLGVGPRATLRKLRSPKGKRNKLKQRPKNYYMYDEGDMDDASVVTTKKETSPPPLSQSQITSSVTVVDKFGGWMTGWKDNFATLGIPKLRSLMNAHADPYDHRSLEFYAEARGRGEELMTLPHLCQRDNQFKGPYQAPSTNIFNEFHDILPRAYGVQDIVEKGVVRSIRPTPSEDWSDEPIFEVDINDPGTRTGTAIRTIKTKRVVCAMGPLFRPSEAFWEASLKKELMQQDRRYPSDRILKYNQIMSFIKDQNRQANESEAIKINNLLIVGGGITSAQMALLALSASWCDKVTLIQRSAALPRHFDLNNKWMGPQRGKLLDEFWSMDHERRAQLCQEERQGGSIPPEIIQELYESQSQHGDTFQWKEEVQISSVTFDYNGNFQASLDDGTECQPDMIWLATGSETHIDLYTALTDLRKVLPMRDVQGLPILNKDLSWRAPPGVSLDEPKWKATARERFWCMGALAALELGPDALNLIGARAGAVAVAQAVRDSFVEVQSPSDNSTAYTTESSACSCCC